MTRVTDDAADLKDPAADAWLKTPAECRHVSTQRTYLVKT